MQHLGLALSGACRARRRVRAAAACGTTSRALSGERSSLPLDVPAVCVWGANTGVGKTLFSAGLALAALRNGVCFVWIACAIVVLLPS